MQRTSKRTLPGQKYRATAKTCDPQRHYGKSYAPRRPANYRDGEPCTKRSANRWQTPGDIKPYSWNTPGTQTQNDPAKRKNPVLYRTDEWALVEAGHGKPWLLCFLQWITIKAYHRHAVSADHKQSRTGRIEFSGKAESATPNLCSQVITTGGSANRAAAFRL